MSFNIDIPSFSSQVIVWIFEYIITGGMGWGCMDGPLNANLLIHFSKPPSAMVFVFMNQQTFPTIVSDFADSYRIYQAYKLVWNLSQHLVFSVL